MTTSNPPLNQANSQSSILSFLFVYPLLQQLINWIFLMILKNVWKISAMWGTRHLTSRLLPPASYEDTVCYFNTDRPLIALTIDDGLSRGGPATSMAPQVLELLQKHNAKATFFVCTEYCQNQGDTITSLLNDGHELGNHLHADLSFHYPKLSKEEFRQALEETNSILEVFENQAQQASNLEKDDDKKETQKDTDNTHSQRIPHSSAKSRWFRAPQGIMTQDMKQVVNELDMQSALGDCYCDDWRFAMQVQHCFNQLETMNNEESQEQQQSIQQIQSQQKIDIVCQEIAVIMLSQVQYGSIAIVHMPEVGFRQGTLRALEFFLQGLDYRGIQCVTLSQLQQLTQSSHVNKNDGAILSHSKEA